MKRTKYYCDVCGKELKKGVLPSVYLNIRLTYVEPLYRSPPEERYDDFCPDCLETLRFRILEEMNILKKKAQEGNDETA